MSGSAGRSYRLTLCLLSLIGVLGCGVSGAAEESATGTGGTVHKPSLAYELWKLREGLSPLDFHAPAPDSGAAALYFDYYGLSAPRHDHRFGAFSSGPHVLAAHAYRPDAARGTVIVMHGYLDHTGTLSSTIQHLLARGFAVAAYDQPGHGLSSGPAASIEDFADYASVFEDFMTLCRAHMPAPYHALAHSTGAAILVDHLLSGQSRDIERVVLVAPLIHSAHWHLSRVLTPVAEIFVDDVPRVYRNNTSDKQFLEFVRHDPLQSRRAPLAWFDALVEWNERAQGYAPSPRPVAIIQGDADSVVDWRYNLEVLNRKFPNARVDIIEGGRHQLLNEAPPMRARVLRIVDEILSAEAQP